MYLYTSTHITISRELRVNVHGRLHGKRWELGVLLYYWVANTYPTCASWKQYVFKLYVQGVIRIMRKLFCKSQKSLVIMRMSILNYFTMSILNYFISKTNKQKKHMRLFASLLMECIHMLPNSKEFTVKSRVSPKSGFQVQLPRGNHRLLINIYLKITVIFFFRK